MKRRVFHQVPSRDAAGVLYEESDTGELSPRFRPDLGERGLPLTVEPHESLAASRRGGGPWDQLDFNASSREQQARIGDLNNAMRSHYGETGEADNDYGQHYVDPDGHDTTPERLSPTPSKEDLNARYLFTTGLAPTPNRPGENGDVAEKMYEGAPNRRPFIAPDYPSGPSPEPRQIEAGDYVVDVRLPDPAAVRRAQAERAGLQKLNALHRRHYSRGGA